jgi:tryptophan synthase alpha subunit
VWQVIEQRAKELKDAAKAELQALEVGDAVAGKWDGKVIAKASKSKGRTKLTVTDEQAFLDWVSERHPTEVVYAVNPAFVKALEARAKDIGLGAVVSTDGEVVPGVEIVEGEPYVTVRREKDAPFLVAQLLSSGRLSLEGVSRWVEDKEAGAIG